MGSFPETLIDPSFHQYPNEQNSSSQLHGTVSCYGSSEQSLQQAISSYTSDTPLFLLLFISFPTIFLIFSLFHLMGRICS